MSTQQEIQDLPQQPIGILDPTKLPPNAAALTHKGETFTRIAKKLQTAQARRRQVLQQYEEKQKELAPIIEELYRIHAMIDTLIGEMAKS